jgi:hypothetical protein
VIGLVPFLTSGLYTIATSLPPDNVTTLGVTAPSVAEDECDQVQPDRSGCHRSPTAADQHVEVMVVGEVAHHVWTAATN